MGRYFYKPQLIGIRQVWDVEAPHVSWSHWLASHKILSPGAAGVFCHHLIKRGIALNLAYPLLYELPTFSYQELLLDSCLPTVFLPASLSLLIGSLLFSISSSLYLPAYKDYCSSLSTHLLFLIFLSFFPSSFPLFLFFFSVYMYCIVRVFVHDF